MTAEQIFSQVLGLMFSGKTEMEEFSNGFLCQLNLKLADTFQQKQCPPGEARAGGVGGNSRDLHG